MAEQEVDGAVEVAAEPAQEVRADAQLRPGAREHQRVGVELTLEGHPHRDRAAERVPADDAGADLAGDRLDVRRVGLEGRLAGGRPAVLGLAVAAEVERRHRAPVGEAVLAAPDAVGAAAPVDAEERGAVAAPVREPVGGPAAVVADRLHARAFAGPRQRGSAGAERAPSIGVDR